MTISVVMPCYNGARWLAEAVASVAAQTRGDWEIVIVDDGSKDNSVEVARGLAAKDSRIRAIQQANAGPGPARNAGVRASSGAYLVFLDCDDLLEPDFMETMAGVLDGEPQMNGCACEQIVMRTDGTTPVQPLPGKGGRLVIDDILPFNGWAPHAAMIRRELFERVGGFVKMRGAEDWDFWLRCLAECDFIAVRRPLVRYRRHDSQLSGNYALVAAGVMWMMDEFERRHGEIIDRYGRGKYREHRATHLLINAAKALKAKQRWLAWRLSAAAWMRAPLNAAVAKKLAITWLPAPLTDFLARVRK
jgi:glycosyltransferase involved in cell wall biosynthesis